MIRLRVLVACLPLLGGCGAFSGSEAPSLAERGRVGPRVADAMMRAGDPAAAVRVADGMLAADPRDPDARLRRGRALLALGQNAEAAADLATAAERAPGDAGVLADLATARAAAGDGAESAWRAVLARRPADRQARIGLGVALDLQDRHAEAQALYRAVLAERPEDPAARANLGLSLALSGQAQEALGYLDRAGQGRRGRHNLAVALVLAGDEARARSVLGADMSAAEVTSAIESLRALRG